MAALTIKNIPDDLYEHLKRAAKAHHRSINGELIACLESILLPHKVSPDEHIQVARALRDRVKASTLTIDDINRAKNEGRS